MTGSFKNRVFSFEIQPSPEVWGSILTALDAEYLAGDAVVSVKMEAAAIAPPEDLWTAIQSALHPKPKSSVFKLYYRRLAVAAILSAAVSVTALYLFKDSSFPTSSERTAKQSALNHLKPNLPEPVTLSPAKAITLKSTALLSSIIQGRKNILTRNRAFVKANSDLAREKYPSGIHTVSALQPVTITARPILNREGCIVMDMNLICNTNDHYITVTGPNGSQTKISNKFVHWLSSLNTEVSEDNTDNIGVRWKETFQSWRNKLLNERSFIPVASNFFDIFEMKNMVLEQ